MSCMVAGTLCQLCLIFIKTIAQLARSGPSEIWQDHQIYRASGPMVHCPEMLISSPGVHEADEKWGGESKGADEKWGGESVTQMTHCQRQSYLVAGAVSLSVFHNITQVSVTSLE